MLTPGQINKEIKETEELLQRLVRFWEKIPILKKEILRKKLCKILTHIYFDKGEVYDILQNIVKGEINSKAEIENYRQKWFKHAPEVFEIIEFMRNIDSKYLNENEKIRLIRIADGKSKLRDEINALWHDDHFFANVEAARQHSKGLLNLIDVLNTKIEEFRRILECNGPVQPEGEVV
jgi:vacuolar-type H+-ATPase subunit I/STV1